MSNWESSEFRNLPPSGDGSNRGTVTRRGCLSAVGGSVIALGIVVYASRTAIRAFFDVFFVFGGAMAGAEVDPRSGTVDELGQGLEHDISMLALAIVILGSVVLLFAFDVFKSAFGAVRRLWR